MFFELPPEMRARYATLDNTCRAIRENYKRLTATSQMFVDQMENKLDGLSQSYVRLLNSAFHHREYLRTINPDAHPARKLEQLQKDLEQRTAQGAGDQPQAHRDPEQARRKVSTRSTRTAR